LKIARVIIEFKPALDTSFERRIIMAHKLRELISEQSVKREGAEIIFVECAKDERWRAIPYSKGRQAVNSNEKA